jgi:hypothetical protein
VTILNVLPTSTTEPRHAVLEIAHFKAGNNFEAVNKHININVSGIISDIDGVALCVPAFVSFLKWPDDGRYGRNW